MGDLDQVSLMLPKTVSYKAGPKENLISCWHTNKPIGNIHKLAKRR